MKVIKIQSSSGSGVLHTLKAGVEALGQTCNYVDMETALLPATWPKADVYFVRPGKYKVNLNQFPTETVYLLEII